MPEADDIHTSMRCAANEGNVEKVTKLLKDGANVNSINFHKNTALHMAVFYGHKEVAETLIRNGANLDMVNVNGQTVLQLACCKGYLDIVKMITKQGCNLHAQTDYSAMTALHFASKEGQAEICQHLLDVGAEEEVYDAVDKIAEYYAANYPTELVFKKYREKKGGKKSNKTKPQAKTQQQQNAPVKKPEPAKPDPVPAKTKETTPTPTKGKKNSPPPNKGKENTPPPTKGTDKTLPSTKGKDNSPPPSKQEQTKPSSPKQQTQPNETAKPGKSNEPPTKTSAGPTKSTDASGKTETKLKENVQAPSDEPSENTEKKSHVANGGTPNVDKSKAPVGPEANSRSRNKEAPTSDNTRARNVSPDKRDRTRNASPDKRDAKQIPKYGNQKYNIEGRGQGSHVAGGGVEIPKYEKENYDQERQKQELNAAGGGKINLLKDHSFHWSDEHKARMKQSVFDRLGGGGRRKKQPEESDKQEKGKQPAKQPVARKGGAGGNQPQ